MRNIVHILFLIIVLPTLLASIEDSDLSNYWCDICQMMISFQHFLHLLNSVVTNNFIFIYLLFRAVWTYGFLFYSMSYNELCYFYFFFFLLILLQIWPIESPPSWLPCPFSVFPSFFFFFEHSLNILAPPDIPD